jgi:hypothetical protein
VARKAPEGVRAATAQAAVRAAKVPAAVRAQDRDRKAPGAVTAARKAAMVARNTPEKTIAKAIAPGAGKAVAIEVAADL